MSPLYFSDTISHVYVWSVLSTGFLNTSDVWNAFGVRPVINLIPTIEITDITQDGTIEKPYVIKIT